MGALLVPVLLVPARSGCAKESKKNENAGFAWAAVKGDSKEQQEGQQCMAESVLPSLSIDLKPIVKNRR